MQSGAFFTKLTDVLHAVAQSLLIPDIILLLGFIAYALFSIGSIIMEAVKERKVYKVEAPKFLNSLMCASEAELPNVIKNSGLLNRQKQALLTVYDYRTLPGDALVALIRKLVSTEETHYNRITARNYTAAKVAPMAGLMGTLIPLGPGVAALGSGDTTTLSSSLLIAFDTTVAGLIVAVICLAIGKIRSTWYNDYMTTLDAAMATILQKIETLRARGQITVQQPTDYAFMFEEGLKKSKGQKPTKKDSTQSATQAQSAAAGQADTTPRTAAGVPIIGRPAAVPAPDQAIPGQATPGQAAPAQPASPAQATSSVNAAAQSAATAARAQATSQNTPTQQINQAAAQAQAAAQQAQAQPQQAQQAQPQQAQPAAVAQVQQAQARIQAQAQQAQAKVQSQAQQAQAKVRTTGKSHTEQLKAYAQAQAEARAAREAQKAQQADDAKQTPPSEK